MPSLFFTALAAFSYALVCVCRELHPCEHSTRKNSRQQRVKERGVEAASSEGGEKDKVLSCRLKVTFQPRRTERTLGS